MRYPNLSVNEMGHLTFAGQDTVQLARTFGTPLILLDENLIRARCRLYRRALAAHFPPGAMPLYASKALCFKYMYQIMAEEGMGVDVVSSGELFTALKAGFPMERVYFHGNSKTDFDIRFGIESRIGYFICDNTQELDAIEAEAARQHTTQKLLLRLTPGIDPHTHEKINTGRVDCKFGAAIETGQAEELLLRALSKRHVRLCGYHCHIGSQIFDAQPFHDAAVMMLDFAAQMQQRHGYALEILNLGGGLGVPYVASDPQIDYESVLQRIGMLVRAECAARGLAAPTILLEPGRSIVADAGLTLYAVNAIKRIPGFRNYVSVDGGMTDNPRHTLYDAQYTILPANRMRETASEAYTIAGHCCESGDVLQEGVPLPPMQRGDLLATLTSGAYHYSMASNYNRMCRPAVVMLNGEGAFTAVRRETLDDLIQNDL